MRRPIYLDYQATTPLRPEAREAMLPYLGERFGNPHSPHRYGFEADAAVEAARAQVAALVGAAPDTLLFTSGATEASNLALIGTLTAPGQTRRRVVTVATEHACVLDTARHLARAAGAVMHCDAAQAAGKIAIDINALGADLVSLSAHKLYGPKGVGALYVRPGVALSSVLHGGGQEGGGLRSGTLSPALCAGFGTAAALAGAELAAHADHVAMLWDRLLAGLDVPHVVNGSEDRRWRGNLNVSFPGADGGRLMRAVLREVALSAGSACASASGRPSHVLAALGLPGAFARATLRIGWGKFTTAEEIDRAAAVISAAARGAA